MAQEGVNLPGLARGAERANKKIPAPSSRGGDFHERFESIRHILTRQ
jgi:hypothetical protein